MSRKTVDCKKLHEVFSIAVCCLRHRLPAVSNLFASRAGGPSCLNSVVYRTGIGCPHILDFAGRVRFRREERCGASCSLSNRTSRKISDPKRGFPVSKSGCAAGSPLAASASDCLFLLFFVAGKMN